MDEMDGGSRSEAAVRTLSMHPASCPVCAGTWVRRLFCDRNRRENLPISSAYVECCECGTIYLSPVPHWDEFRGYYDWLYQTRAGETVDSREAPLGDRPGILGRVVLGLRRFRFRPHSWPVDPGRGRRLLEVGCGDGLKLMEFAARGWHVVGVDISAAALEQARRNVPSGEFHLGEVGEATFPDRSFHVVRADNVLEHVPNPAELVRHCARLLVPRGRLVIYVPHGRSLSMRLLGRYSNNAWIPFHLTLFCRTGLTRMLQEAGFRRVEMLTYSPIHALPSSLRQLLGEASDPRGWGGLRWPFYALLSPVGWLADRFGMGEELIAVAWT